MVNNYFSSKESMEKDTRKSMEAQYLESPSSPERCEEESPAQASFTSQMAETSAGSLARGQLSTEHEYKTVMVGSGIASGSGRRLLEFE